MPTKTILRSEMQEVNNASARADERRCMRRADTYSAAHVHDDVIVGVRNAHARRLIVRSTRPQGSRSRARRRLARAMSP
jgi:hypothetical protein